MLLIMCCQNELPFRAFAVKLHHKLEEISTICLRAKLICGLLSCLILSLSVKEIFLYIVNPVQKGSHKQVRADSRKYLVFQYQENTSMTQSQALAKAESKCPFWNLAWSFTLGKSENKPMARFWPQFQRCTWMALVPRRWPAEVLVQIYAVCTVLHSSAPQCFK